MTSYLAWKMHYSRLFWMFKFDLYHLRYEQQRGKQDKWQMFLICLVPNRFVKYEYTAFVQYCISVPFTSFSSIWLTSPSVNSGSTSETFKSLSWVCVQTATLGKLTFLFSALPFVRSQHKKIFSCYNIFFCHYIIIQPFFKQESTLIGM